MSPISYIWHYSPVIQHEGRNLQFLVNPPVVFLFQKCVPISDQNVNILHYVETCRTFIWVITPFKELTNLKCNELNMIRRIPSHYRNCRSGITQLILMI